MQFSLCYQLKLLLIMYLLIHNFHGNMSSMPIKQLLNVQFPTTKLINVNIMGVIHKYTHTIILFLQAQTYNYQSIQSIKTVSFASKVTLLCTPLSRPSPQVIRVAHQKALCGLYLAVTEFIHNTVVVVSEHMTRT